MFLLKTPQRLSSRRSSIAFLYDKWSTFVEDDEELVETKHFFEAVDVPLARRQFVLLPNGVDVLKGLYLHVVEDVADRRNVNGWTFLQFLQLIGDLLPDGLEPVVLKLIEHLLEIRMDNLLHNDHPLLISFGLIDLEIFLLLIGAIDGYGWLILLGVLVMEACHLLQGD